MAKARGRRSEVRSQKSEVRSQKSEVRSQKSEVRSEVSLLFYYLDLPIDYLPGKPIKRNVHRVMPFAFDNLLLGVRFSRRIPPTLRHHIDQQIPDARLGTQKRSPAEQLPCEP